MKNKIFKITPKTVRRELYPYVKGEIVYYKDVECAINPFLNTAMDGPFDSDRALVITPLNKHNDLGGGPGKSAEVNIMDADLVPTGVKALFQK